jgi:hypothetical protein
MKFANPPSPPFSKGGGGLNDQSNFAWNFEFRSLELICYLVLGTWSLLTNRSEITYIHDVTRSRVFEDCLNPYAGFDLPNVHFSEQME